MTAIAICYGVVFSGTFIASAASSSSTVGLRITDGTESPPSPPPAPSEPSPEPTVPDASHVSIPDAPTLVVTPTDRYAILVSGRALAGAVVHVSMIGDEHRGQSMMASKSIVVPYDGSWSYVTGALNTGSYSFSAYVESSPPGNISPSVGPVAVSIVLDSPDNVDVSVTKHAELRVSGEGFPGGKVRVRIDGDNGYHESVSVEASENGYFSYTSPRLSLGSYEIFASVRDASGEDGSWTDVRKVSIVGSLSESGSGDGSSAVSTISNGSDVEVSPGSSVKGSDPADKGSGQEDRKGFYGSSSSHRVFGGIIGFLGIDRSIASVAFLSFALSIILIFYSIAKAFIIRRMQ